jgi:4-hydroxy-tetrahydrodipicolinate reductase
MAKAMNDLKIGVFGAAGRMGQMLLREIAETKGCTLGGAGERPGHEAIGRDAGTLAGLAPQGAIVAGEPRTVLLASDVAIDFSAPAATVGHVAMAAQLGKPMVIGTTGLNAAATEAVKSAAKRTAIVLAPNMSLGVNILLALVEQAARALGPDYDIEVLEMHHRQKVDAPSGTALGLGRAAAKGRGIDLAAMSDRVRDGHTGPRIPGRIGFATLRGGDVVGDHTVIYAGDGERLELTHKAANRRIYSRGAVRAALWTRGKAPGLYDMVDVLGLRST